MCNEGKDSRSFGRFLDFEKHRSSLKHPQRALDFTGLVKKFSVQGFLYKVSEGILDQNRIRNNGLYTDHIQASWNGELSNIKVARFTGYIVIKLLQP